MTSRRPTTVTESAWRAGRDYEVQHLMQTTKISAELARELIKKHGKDRDILEREARKLHER